MDDKKNRYRLGHSKSVAEIYLSLGTRLKHCVWYGHYLGGREKVFLQLAEQEIKQKGSGATFVIETPDLASMIYALAKQHKKDVIWLNPEIHLGVKNQLMWETTYCAKKMNEYIVDYQKAIMKGAIVLIDLEPTQYFHHSQRGTALLLWHLRMALPKIMPSQRQPHLLYFENTLDWLPQVSYFLKYGSRYQLGLMMWVESPQLLKQSETNYRVLFEALVGTSFLYSRYAWTDQDFYRQLYAIHHLEQLTNRSEDLCLFSLTDELNGHHRGHVYLDPIDYDEFRKQEQNGKKRKTMLHHQMIKQEEQMMAYATVQNISLEGMEDDLVLDVLSTKKVDIIPIHDNQKEVTQIETEAFQQSQTQQENPIDLDSWKNDVYM